VGRAALLGTLAIVLMLYVSPLHRWLTQRHTAAVQQSDLRDLEQQNKQLRARIKTLRRPAALELEARKLGMVRRGERAFVIENPPKR
jgi:cell division protein FtsB